MVCHYSLIIAAFCSIKISQPFEIFFLNFWLNWALDVAIFHSNLPYLSTGLLLFFQSLYRTFVFLRIVREVWLKLSTIEILVSKILIKIDLFDEI